MRSDRISGGYVISVTKCVKKVYTFLSNKNYVGLCDSCFKFFWLFVALVGFSEEVRSRCHIKHSLPRYMADSMSQEFIIDNVSSSNAIQQGTTSGSNSSSNVNRRQKSWDLLDQSALAQARVKQPATAQHQVRLMVHLVVLNKYWS